MKLLVFIEDFFNDIELVTPLSIWKKSNKFSQIDFYHHSLKSARGQFGFAQINNILNDINLDEYDLVFIPGGRGAQDLRKNFDALDKIKKLLKQETKIAMICDAPNVLSEHKIIDSSFTSFPSDWSKEFRKDNYIKTDLVITSKFMSASSAAVAEKLAYCVLANIFSQQAAIDTFKSITGTTDITYLEHLLIK
ncbi:4-methyl-5(b-hydroxyethyl)-thiazole monophosphate biosynthesis [Mycoplasmopsis mustelae]|uniref:4-methyl-5(B-hydroxyethyl)-thiazole monophosphate biosynthesis n=1 Tax=Mycoplasmopsis mustelae TaxID=171289 RepID=A0A4R7UEF9_9BACT|nr:DJ-1/PfpI family protein [Mycoplasmopsis mustelae]TDV24311.1 4-methyl-5(b-hydroxyethyl)-thiazole monophosphate biosynthesis [Mycoplasmopsis mustelae]